MAQGKTYNILLIEADPSFRRLISLGLEHQGMHIIEASSPATAPVLDTQQLHLLILDIDNGMKSDWSLLEAAQKHPHFAALPTIVLSWEQLSLEHQSQGTVVAPTQTLCLTKPFDARKLYSMVAQMLAAKETREAMIAEKAEEQLLAAYSSHAAPSIWPVVTAAGILLTIIGMLLQITVTALGILIVIIGLLVWTLGTKPEQKQSIQT